MSFSNKNKNISSEPSITISSKTANKIGLFGAMSIIIGAMIGIGIFFKNGGVFTNNNGNPYGVILSWIIAFVIALSTAYSYGEIVSAETKSKNSGLAGWSSNFCGYNYGRFVKISHPIFYYALYVLVIGMFAAEAIWNLGMAASNQGAGIILAGNNHAVLYVLLTVLALIAIFIAVNYFCYTFSKRFGQITTVIKFLPLILIALAGIIFGCINSQHNLFIHPGNVFNDELDTLTSSGQLTFTGILASLPAILFAFDSFLIVGNIAGDVKNPTRNIPLSIILSMVISGALYLFVTIGQICVGCGSAYDVFNFIFKNNEAARKAFEIIVSVSILISILGVLNSLTMGAIRSIDAAVEENVLAISPAIKKITKNRELLGGTIVLSILIFVYWAIITIPSSIVNTDQIIDGISNLVVLFYFAIYASVVLGSMINRATGHVKEIKKQRFQLTLGTISVIGCLLAVCYCAFYQYIYLAATKPLADASYYTGWGLFASGNGLNMRECALVFWVSAIIFFIQPLINDLIIKFTNKNYNQPLIWESAKNYQI